MNKPYTGANGFYSKVVPENINSLLQFYHQVTGDEMPSNDGELHATVMYSKAALKITPAVAYQICQSHNEAVYQAAILGFDFWSGHDGKGYFVVKLASHHLTMRHNRWKLSGAVPTFDPYEAHMTLLTGPDAIKASTFVPILKAGLKARGTLSVVLHNETIEDLKD